MEQYTVTGMSCAACSARVEKAVSKVPGVHACSVNLLTNSMGVEGDASSGEIIKAVEKAGYGAALKKEMATTKTGEADLLKDRETPALKKRLLSSLIFLLVLMYFSMGHTMFSLPVPAYFSNNPLAMGLLQLLCTVAIMVVNRKFFVSGFKSLWHKAPNMDTLVALGAGAAFVYSTYVLFAMTASYTNGDIEAAAGYLHEFYFESAAMILTLITVGKMLEAMSKGRTTDALKGLMQLSPERATIVKDGIEAEVLIRQVKKGDIFVVRPGERIPVDGIVLEGNSAVNEAALTGESIPADKKPGDYVSAATTNQSGFLKCRADRVGEDTTLSHIIQMVSDAAATKAPIAKAADKVSGVFVPVVIAIAIVTTAVWLLIGKTVGFALARGISVLVISCPCALGLATPVAIMVGNGVAAKNGILFKTAAALEKTGKMQIAALDKTGTITKGEPKVTDVISKVPGNEQFLLEAAYSLEIKSEHPLAKAVVEYAKEKKNRLLPVTEFKALSGSGVSAVYQGKKMLGGNYEFISSHAKIDTHMQDMAKKLSKEGKTPLFFVSGQTLLGMIAVADTIKEDSREAIAQLKKLGLYVVMLTGDNSRTASAIGKEAGVDEVIAGVLPEGKEKAVRNLQKKGRVLMVGDGINDAPALTRADMSIAIGAGTDIAIEAADIVLMKSRLTDVATAIRLSRKTLQNIHENLFWAFIYNVIGIPLAAGVWIPLTGWQLNPMFGAAAMSLSSFCVVTNALRLNLFKVHVTDKDKTAQNTKAAITTKNETEKEMEEKKVEKTMIIEGMMCGHCEATVKKALEALEQVTEARVSHETKTAVVTLKGELADEALIKAVEEKDYKVISIK